MVWGAVKSAPLPSAAHGHLQQLPCRQGGRGNGHSHGSGGHFWHVFEACWSKNSGVSWLQEWNGSPQRHEGTKKS